MCQLFAQHARNTLACFLMKKRENIKANKRIAIIRKFFEYSFPRNSLSTIYKSSIKPYLDYCDITYERPNDESFCIKIECVHYNAALPTTGEKKETSCTKLYKELGLAFLRFSGWFRQLCTFFKIKSKGKLEYLLI